VTSTRNSWRFHPTITECRARILDRGTGVASYNQAKVLAQRG
jgi:hypothetical protein